MRFAVWLIERPRWFKRTVLIINDLAVLTIALWLAYSLRLSQLYVPDTLPKVLLMAAAPVIGVVVFYMRGLYKLVTRFIGPEGTTRIYVAVIIAAVLWALVVLMSGVKVHPRSVIVIYGLIAAGLIRLSRQWAGATLLRLAPEHKGVSFDERKRVIIYGAGTIGIQLLRALNETGTYKTVAFIDSNPSLAGQMVHGVKVLRPEKIGKTIADENVKEVLLATPSALRGERRLAIRLLEAYPVVVKTLPALEEIASGHVEVSDLRPIDVEDLLGRDPVTPDLELLAANVHGKVVMITGAGGSIGSELTRQLLRLGPKILVLFELSEVALYEISMEIEELNERLHKDEAGADETTRMVQVLGSVLDRKLVARTIEELGVEVIYHAAAYKHVPIVEANPFAGLHNNTFGTLVVAEAAKELGVERFVLVSSDKAVRPTNIMGASKRLAELILQAFAQEPHSSTIFTMVRFGNVLEFIRLGGAALPQPDQGGRPGHRDSSGGDPLFHVDPRGRSARHPGGDHGDRGRGVRARDGNAGEDRRSRPHHDPPFGPRGARRGPPRRRHRYRIYRAQARREALRGASDRREHDRHQPSTHLQELRADPSFRGACRRFGAPRRSDSEARHGGASGDAARHRRRLCPGKYRASGFCQGRMAARLTHASLRRWLCPGSCLGPQSLRSVLR